MQTHMMEFSEKPQQLRKQKGLTQEALARTLYISRPAISKWESGRGYPSIESLKALAAFFGVTIDELLSGNELLTIAQEDSKQKEHHLRSLVFGLLDLSVGLFFFLPLFGQKINGTVQSVSLLSLTGFSPWLKSTYFLVILGMILLGIMTLALQNCHHALWEQNKAKASLGINTVGALLFIFCRQPYAAAFLFVYLLIKVFLLTKHP